MDEGSRVDGTYRFGQFRFDANPPQLWHDASPIALRPTISQVLRHLIENAGRTISKDEFLKVVWGGRIVEEANLSQTIFWLRTALQDHGGAEAAALIATVRGFGYRFTAPVTWEATPGSSPQAAAPIASPDLASSRTRFRWPIIAATLTGCGLAAALSIGSRHRPKALPSHGNTVVLSDFANRTGDPVFDRTLASVIRIDLGQSPFVTVMPDKDVRDAMVLMTKPAESPVTGPVAEEVCTRRNADAVLGGGVYAVGTRYVVTLIATDCSGRQTLAAEKANVATRDDVVGSLDDLIAKVRTRLGEPIASVDRFNIPLAAERTVSLDALRAFSEGVWLKDHGRQADAAPLFKQAVDLDPDFAAAHAYLGIDYAALYQPAPAAIELTAAYRLRGTLNARERLRVAALYDRFVTRDYDDHIRTLNAWTLIYPDDIRAWGNLADAETLLGEYQPALRAASRMMALHPDNESPYQIMARVQQRLGRPVDADATAQIAVKRAMAGGATHELLLESAVMRHDANAIRREINWSQTTPTFPALFEVQGEMAYGQGRLRDGARAFAQADEITTRQGMASIADAYRARVLVDLGLPDQARALLVTVTSADDADRLFAMAEVGDPRQARVLLDDQLRRYPHGTLIRNVYAPQIRAVLALRDGNPAQAIAELQPALPYRARNFDISFLLGRAYLAAGRGPEAQRAFQEIVDHQGWYPVSPLHTLAGLGVARALVIQHNATAARRAYRRFLADWAGADADLPLLRSAKAEYARLS